MLDSASITGSSIAARHSSFRSLPEKPSVSSAISVQLKTASSETPPSSVCSTARRSVTSGRSTLNARGMRRCTAGSSSHGRFVAPSTRTLGGKPDEPPDDKMPSHNCRNSAFISRYTSWSPDVRSRNRASISSMNMMHGSSRSASENAARTSALLSPMYLSSSELGARFRKRAPDSFASAFASMVLPVPGGPNRSAPFGGCSNAAFCARANSSACSSGAMMSSLSCFFVSNSPPTSSKPVEICAGSTTCATIATS
mmetsp:Transcript_1493/g.3980  ORF Transcript_1493/g.3980 Transcript_1493/m.3980 type:complete len:255 (-) Transcript_1493:273-1037(-)